MTLMGDAVDSRVRRNKRDKRDKGSGSRSGFPRFMREIRRVAALVVVRELGISPLDVYPQQVRSPQVPRRLCEAFVDCTRLCADGQQSANGLHTILSGYVEMVVGYS